MNDIATLHPTLARLVAYLSACPDEVRAGETAADVAIRWHKELVTLRDKVAELETAKVEYETDTEWRDRLDQCQAILDLLDDLPERADDFVQSAGEKVRDIAKWVETNQHVTEKQAAALDNIEAGAERWQR